MRRLISFFAGIGLGTGIGVALVALFAPVSGEPFRENLRLHYREAMDAAQRASSERRAELEAELATLYGEDSTRNT